MHNYSLDTRRVFTGKVVRVDEVDLDFKNGQTATYELVNFDTLTGVSALPVTATGVILIRHYLAGLDKVGWSLPTGGLNKGEDPKKRMQTELQEELGYKAGKLTLMLRAHLMPGYLGSEAGYLFLAQALTPSRLPGDETYDIEVVKLTWPEVDRLMKDQKIADARTLLALLWYERHYG